MQPASVATARTTMLSRRRIPAASTTNGCLLVCLFILVLSSSSAHALTSTKRGGGGTSTFRHLSALRLTPPSSSSASSSIESSYWGTRVSSQRSSERRQGHNSPTRMDLEVPNPTYTTTTTTQQGPSSSRRNAGSWLNLPAAAVRIPAPTTTSKSTKASEDATSSSCLPTPYFQHFWDKQVNVMKARLHKLQEIPLPTSSSASTSSSHDMSVVENDTSRMITKTFKSDEYSYIRMTMLTGKHSQVFTSVWYPSSPHLPILACDLLQFGGASASQQRHLCIVDYQPVIVPGNEDESEFDADVAQHNHEIDQRVEFIRQQYPGLHGQMSQRFYPEGSPFFSSQMLLGRHLRTPSASNSDCKAQGEDDSSLPSYETSHDMVKDVYEAWQLYMDEHVSWTQQEQVQEKDQDPSAQDQENLVMLRQQRHAKYDKFSSQYDPALPMLSHMYGAEFADAYVHDVLFPLSRQRQ